jgi:hypothetical protein
VVTKSGTYTIMSQTSLDATGAGGIVLLVLLAATALAGWLWAAPCDPSSGYTAAEPQDRDGHGRCDHRHRRPLSAHGHLVMISATRAPDRRPRARASGDQAVAVGMDDRLDTVAQAEFGEDA